MGDCKNTAVKKDSLDYEVLINEITSLNDNLITLRMLHSRILSEDVVDCPTENKMVSLSELLHDGSRRIKEYRESFSSIVNNIEDILFS
jgi:hypothetical protein